MSKEEVQEVLDELQTVRPEMLNDNAKRLFEAIMSIADKRDILQQRIDNAIHDLQCACLSMPNALLIEIIEEAIDELQGE